MPIVIYVSHSNFSVPYLSSIMLNFVIYYSIWSNDACCRLLNINKINYRNKLLQTTNESLFILQIKTMIKKFLFVSKSFLRIRYLVFPVISCIYNNKYISKNKEETTVVYYFILLPLLVRRHFEFCVAVSERAW
jgi:hypothetical protein